MFSLNLSKFNSSKSKLFLTLLCGSLTATAILGSANIPTIAQTIPESDITRQLKNKADYIPEKVARKLINQVAKETKQSPNQIIINTVKAFEFNGCMGIYERLVQPCTANVIPGWKAILTSSTKNKPQNLVYHLDGDGTRIIQNKTASGAKSSIQPSFMPYGIITPISPKTVFRSSANQTFGRITRTELTEDGKINILQGKAKPITIKTLSPTQVSAFKVLLETQRFPNFNGIHYITNNEKNNFLTTDYQIPYISIQVMNSEKKNVPLALQQIIASWENLIQPINPKLSKLQQQLDEKKWGPANQETQRLLTLPETSNSLIRDIDRAWLTASNHRFGLSIQAKIWQQSKAKHPKNQGDAVNAFRDRVGWKIAQPRSGDNYDFISGDWLNEPELNYSLKAPIGHLPWAGVPEAQVQATLNEVVNGCGSCTTDAMQMRNEHFYVHIPALFDRVRIALTVTSRIQN